MGGAGLCGRWGECQDAGSRRTPPRAESSGGGSGGGSGIRRSYEKLGAVIFGQVELRVVWRCSGRGVRPKNAGRWMGRAVKTRVLAREGWRRRRWMSEEAVVVEAAAE